MQTQDQGLTRFDVAPTVRVPFNRWAFLGINSSMTWRATYWTERLQTQVPVPTVTGKQVDEGVARQYFDFSVRATGPVFNRIFNPPEGKEGTKYKHVIQPSVTLQKVTNFDVFDQIVKLESGDYTIGRTQVTYDLTNRLYAKKEVAREILSVSLNQSYYTDARAAQYHQQYQSSFTAKRASNFSPVSLQFRTSPTDRVGGDFRTEWDPTAHALRSFAANANFSSGNWLNGSVGWSQRRFIPELPGFDDPNLSDQYINSTVNIRSSRNKYGGNYSFNYDVKNDRFLNQRWIPYYNSQCCGVAVEYQTFNLQGSFVQTNVTHDRRFNISFTLAGIGTFSNLFGAFGGQQSR